MEQYRHWMWKRRKLNESSNKDSWEEQAFAEDSAGILGDCIWPPRSYSCSFCRREFKSAQALGGHMNVHRRDRARLKQSSSPQNENFQHHHQNHHQNPCTISLGDENQSQVCSLVYNPNPSVVRVSTSSTQDNCNEQTLVSPCSPTIVQQHPKGFLISPLSPCSTPSVNVNFLKVSDSKLEGDKKKSRAQEPGYQSEEDYVKTNSAVSLNLVLFDSKLGSLSNKRQKIDSSPLPFSRKSGSIDICHLQSEVLNLIPSSMEELDLELRLGNLPKVVMIQY